MKIIVDADACPRSVLQETVRTGAEYGVQVVTVASFEHNITSDLHITVGNSSQEADLKIINITEPGDLIIPKTGDLLPSCSQKGVSSKPRGDRVQHRKDGLHARRTGNEG